MVGFQVTPPIDYTLGYVLKKHTHKRVFVYVPPDGQLNYDHGGRDIALKLKYVFRISIRRLNPGVRTKINRIGTIRFDFITFCT